VRGIRITAIQEGRGTDVLAPRHLYSARVVLALTVYPYSFISTSQHGDLCSLALVSVIGAFRQDRRKEGKKGEGVPHLISIHHFSERTVGEVNLLERILWPMHNTYLVIGCRLGVLAPTSRDHTHTYIHTLCIHTTHIQVHAGTLTGSHACRSRRSSWLWRVGENLSIIIMIYSTQPIRADPAGRRVILFVLVQWMIYSFETLPLIPV
jgi:hypothetical protein